MKQLVQSVSSGHLRHIIQPDIAVRPTALRVAVHASLISSGTERSMHELAGASLLQKAKARPDLVRAVVDRARQSGIKSTVDIVRSRLDEDMPVGYSAAGIVTGVGETVAGFRPGDRVVTAGVGHAEVQSVPGNLAARLPDSISFEEGSFGAIASVALHGLRLAGVEPGSKIAVIGLGLIGQLAVRLALAAGCDVAGTDLDAHKVNLAAAKGAVPFSSDDEGISSVLDWTAGRGVGAVLVTAATRSSRPMRMAASLAHDRATVVAVGDVGMDLDRRTLYEKELMVRVSRAYGPGRYDPVYEDLGIDYPVGFVRWPIARNLETVVNLIATKRLEVADLVTHRFPFDRAEDAYEVFDGKDHYLGILLEYPTDSKTGSSVVRLDRAENGSQPSLGLATGFIGAGRFTASVLLPAAIAAGLGPFTRITSAGGCSAVRVGERHGFSEAVTAAEDVYSDPATDIVFVASQHDTHAEYVAAALEANKHVFCEKPLAITEAELDRVAAAWNRGTSTLMVGFNRRWSPAIMEITSFVGRGSPIQIIYRIHAGALPSDHWLADRRQGGRLLGEGCHFIDTCNAVIGETPRTVYAIGSGTDELLLREDFTITLEYPSASQAVIIYSSGSPHGTGKEWIEVMRGDKSAEIDDFRSATLRSATSTSTIRYRPPDKGHRAEVDVFRRAVEGECDGDELARAGIETSHIALAAVDSLMTGLPVHLDWS